MKSCMMKKFALVPLTAAALLVAAGCGQQQQMTTTRGGKDMAAVKPAPKPAAKPMESGHGGPTTPAPAPAASAPAPAPMMGSGNWMAFPTGDRSTSAVLVETAMPREVRANTPFSYDIVVTNLTNMPLQNVILTGAGFTNLTVANTTPAFTQGGQAACGGNPISWNLGDIPAKGQKTVKVNASAPGTGSSSNCFNVSYNNCLCVATNVVDPKLELVKQVSCGGGTWGTNCEATVCDQIQYKFIVRNPGTGTATNVRVKDQLPAGLTTTDGKNMLDLDAGTLAPGASRELTVACKGTKTGKYDNNATATADGGLTAQSGTVSSVLRQPNLSVNVACSKEVFLGRNACFDYTVTNTGDAPCNAVLTATVPSGSTVASASDGGTGTGNLSWNLGSLAPGASKKVTACYRAAAGATGALTSSASVTCPCSNTAQASCTTQVVGIPAQLLDGVDDPDPVQIGENVTYTLYVTNQGTTTLTNVKLVSTMDLNTMQFVSANGPTGAGQVAGATVTFPPIPTLQPKERREYKVVVKATKEGQVSFKSESSSDQITVPLRKDETTNFYK